jgi:hypothetical protein
MDVFCVRALVVALYILSTRKLFVGVSLALGFLSMRHSAIFEEEVDF